MAVFIKKMKIRSFFKKISLKIILKMIGLKKLALIYIDLLCFFLLSLKIKHIFITI